MKKQKPKECSKCGTELGLACFRLKSQGGSVRRIKDIYYCRKCNKFGKIVEEFKEIK